MAFSLSILPVISVLFESKYFCASSTPSAGFEAASTRLTSSLVKESKSVRIALASASFLQPASGRQAKQISRARTLVRISGAASTKLVLKRYHLTDHSSQSQENSKQ